MHFTLTSEQAQLRDALQHFLRDQYPLAARTQAAQADGWRPGIWRRLGAELGVLGAGFAEHQGGSGGGAVEHLVVMEALGEALVLEPYVESVVLAGRLLTAPFADPVQNRDGDGDAAAPPADCASAARASAAWAEVLRGDAVAAVAWAEAAACCQPKYVATRAQPTTQGWRLEGAKAAVVAAPWARHLLVSARTAGAVDDAQGISLFLVDAGTPGLRLRPFHTLDGRRAADVEFDGATLPPTALLGPMGQALPLLAQALDEAVSAQCAESVGLMARLLRETVDYTRQRRQFGQPIASFQVLQHRMADMLMQLELARSATYGATLALDDADAAARACAVSAAKVTVDDALRFIGQNAIQLHGGMGMSDATPVTHGFRRATVIEASLGSRAHHLARFTQLS